MNYSNLLPQTEVRDTVKQWLEEDIPSFDVGGFVVGNSPSEANILFKSQGVLAGIPFAQAVFDLLQCTVIWKYEEGAELVPDGSKIAIATVTGATCDILKAERTVLNILSRASGVATQASNAVKIAREHNWRGTVAGTRKTTPGFRLVEKYALLVGGASTHRHDLSQMVMLKDNHIWATGSITGAVTKAKTAAGFSMKIEVECQSLEEAVEAATAGADIVMLDNFSPDAIGEAARRIKEQFPHVLIEASGGITQATMGQFMGPDVDIISRGSLTQGYPCIDISMKIAH